MLENVSADFDKLSDKKYISKNKFESEEYPNELTLQVIRDAELGKNMYGPFDTVAEVMEALNAED